MALGSLVAGIAHELNTPIGNSLTVASTLQDQTQEFGNFGYPFMNIMNDNTPENFRAALELARQRLLAETNGLRILNLNCWNEWTEGSYLEPDTVHGMAYLDGVRTVFTNVKLNWIVGGGSQVGLWRFSSRKRH